MQNSKLIKVLKTFSKQEWKNFEKFVTSPYYNKGRNYKPLLRELKKFYPEFDSLKLTSELLYLKLYPGKRHNRNVIKTLFTGLYRIAEEFLIQENLKQNSESKQPILIRELSDRGLKSEVENIINKINKHYISKEKSWDDYRKKHILFEEIYDHYFLNDERIKLGDLREKYNMFALKHMLLELIITEKERGAQKSFIKDNFRKSTLGKAIAYINYGKIIKELEKNNPEDTFILSIYYYFLISVKYPNNDSYYFKAKSLAEEHYEKMDNDMRKRCYINLENICAEKLYSESYEWNTEIFALYEKILNDKLYFPLSGRGAFFGNRLFRNIVSVSLSLKKNEWTEKFIAEYIDDTNPKFRENLLNNSLAKIEFNKRNYDKALMHAGKIEQKQIIYKIDSRNITAKIYYETNSYEHLYSLLDSYKHLLNNTNINNKILINRHLNFIKYLTKIVKIKLGDSGISNLHELKSTLNKTKHLNNKIWLLEKIAELENKKGGV